MRHRWLSLLIFGAVTLSTLSFHPFPTHSASYPTVSRTRTQPRQAGNIRIQQANPVVNEQRQLSLTATDASGQPITGVTWESGSPDIASVDPNTGVVSGIQRGFATITARRGSDSISVFVVVARVANAQGAKVPGDTKTDTAGHLYISDPLGNVIFRKENLAMPASIFAGQRGAGARIDGNRLQARFAGPTAVTVNNSADGGIFVADTLNHSLRQIDFDDNVTTILGTGSPGRMSNDVTPFAQAVFNGLRGVVTDSGGNLFVADTDNHAIYQVDFESKQVILLAGQPGTSGIVDGRGRAARFNRPSGLALSPDGKLLIVADTGNNRVRLVARNGTVATLGRKSSARGVLESSASPSFLRPEEHQLLIRRLAAIPAQAENELTFMVPQSVSADAVGNIYVVDQMGASVVTRAFGDLPQKVQLAQDGSFQQAASVQVRGTESFVLDTQAQAETNALKVVSIGAPLINSLSRTSDTLNGGSEVIINGKNFAPESVVILGDRVILDA
ncbi:MAG TPA: Ig-like domain-containing protein, partial [Acidobacteriota bacterium]|nr:Ig-like domain-containing protein [Acidobacteriota bacterium]